MKNQEHKNTIHSIDRKGNLRIRKDPNPGMQTIIRKQQHVQFIWEWSTRKFKVIEHDFFETFLRPTNFHTKEARELRRAKA